MTKKNDNIELRSEKVRNIIGQIPPKIIRFGITIIFFIIIILLVGSNYFEYSYTIKTTVILKNESNKITAIVKIPANEINKVKIGHKLIIKFDNIPNLYNTKFETQIKSLPKKIDITAIGGYYYAEILIPDTVFSTDKNELIINGKITTNTEKISFFERIIEPFKFLIF